MVPRWVAFVAVALLAVSGLPTASAQPASNESVGIESIYPNPVADGDRGEFVVLRTDRRLTNWTLADDDGRVRLPNTTVTGRVVFSTAPNRTRNLTTRPVRELPGGLALANSGERLTLAHDGRTVETIRYTDAPEGERGRPTTDGIDWQPLGATNFSVVTGSGGQVRAFVLPDGGTVPGKTLASADRRILLAGYTLTSGRVRKQLSAAASRGVEVRMLVDGSPVGGMTTREATMLDRLAATEATVSVLGGEYARYEFHHAKYAVVDDRALVTTENWKPSGTGGHASRGWGVVVSDPAVVSGLVETFRADAGWRDAISWQQFRQGKSFTPPDSPPANETYPQRFESKRLRADRIGLVRAPDSADRRVVGLINNASDSIRIEQVSIGSRQQPFLQATLRAARRGVEVRVLLSSAWYVEEDNRELVQWLNDRAARENLPLDARLASPNGRFEKIHAKGLIVDGDTVVVGSLNWNNHSARQNREVAVVLKGEQVGGYYTRVFEADWQGGRWRLTVGLAVVIVLGTLLAVVVGRWIEFEDEAGVQPPDTP